MLKDRTLFITGASRGIGNAIALRAARDGANVVVAAKTVHRHPKLPGTIHSAAEEIEAAGGKGLACITDIRFEDEIQSAVDKAVETFGRDANARHERVACGCKVHKDCQLVVSLLTCVTKAQTPSNSCNTNVTAVAAL